MYKEYSNSFSKFGIVRQDIHKTNRGDLIIVRQRAGFIFTELFENSAYTLEYVSRRNPNEKRPEFLVSFTYEYVAKIVHMFKNKEFIEQGDVEAYVSRFAFASDMDKYKMDKINKRIEARELEAKIDSIVKSVLESAEI